MPIPRKPYKHGDSHVVALPREVRDQLNVEPGDHLYFHLVRGGEVVLAATSVREGGRPEGLKLRAQLARAKQRITELEEKVRASWEAAWNEFRTQEAARVLKLQVSGLPVLDAINGRLRDIEAQLGIRRGPWHYRPKRGTPRAETVRGPDSYPGPSARPESSAQVHEEGAAPARPIPDPPPPLCRVCGEAWAAHPKPDHAWDTPPVGVEERGVGAERPLSGQP